MAEPTPLERVIKENQDSQKIIEKCCKKWAERTRKDATPWPAEGTLVVPMLVQMEEKIRNHKKSEKGEKRRWKRERELEILMEFGKIAGKDKREQSEERQREASAPKASEAWQWGEGGERPPPYAGIGKLYPELPGIGLMCPVGLAGPEVSLGALQIHGPPQELARIAAEMGRTQGTEGAKEEMDEAGGEGERKPPMKQPQLLNAGESEDEREKRKSEEQKRWQEERQYVLTREPMMAPGVSAMGPADASFGAKAEEERQRREAEDWKRRHGDEGADLVFMQVGSSGGQNEEPNEESQQQGVESKPQRLYRQAMREQRPVRDYYLATERLNAKGRAEYREAIGPAKAHRTSQEIAYGAQKGEQERMKERRKPPAIQEEAWENLRTKITEEMEERAKLSKKNEPEGNKKGTKPPESTAAADKTNKRLYKDFLRWAKEQGGDWSQPRELTESDLEEDEEEEEEPRYGAEERCTPEEMEMIKYGIIGDLGEEEYEESMKLGEEQSRTRPQPKGMTPEEKSEIEATLDKMRGKMEELKKGLQRMEKDALIAHEKQEAGQEWFELQMKQNQQMRQDSEELKRNQEYIWKTVKAWREECLRDMDMGGGTRSGVAHLLKEVEEMYKTQEAHRTQTLIGATRQEKIEADLEEIREGLKQAHQGIERIQKSQQKQLERAEELEKATAEGIRTLEASLAELATDSDEDEEEDHGADQEHQASPREEVRARAAQCAGCDGIYKGEAGLRIHQGKNPACEGKGGKMLVARADGTMYPVMIPPAMIAAGLWSINKVKKGVEKGLSEMRKGMRKGLNEIESGVKKSLHETKKELKKEGKENEKRRKERLQQTEEAESDEEAHLMAPLIIKGAVAHYQPWTHTDVEGLIQRLPVLQEGAGMWITKFEDETVGKTLALGDLKYVLSKVLGKADAESTLEKERLGRVMNDPSLDQEPFDKYRNRVWRALRQTYPSQYSPNAVCIDKLKDDENPVAFVEKAAQMWRTKMEQDPDYNNAVRSQFRHAVMDSLPKKVREMLKKDWRMGSMTKEEFRQAVSHFVTLYRQEQEEEEQQGKEASRKLTQMQIQETKNARKAAVQAPVVQPAEQQQKQAAQQPQQPAGTAQGQVTTGQPAIQVMPAQPQVVPQAPQQGQMQPGIIMYVPNTPQGAQWQQPMGQWSQPRNRGGRNGWQGQRNNQNQQNQQGQGPPVCWKCNGVGHISRHCANRQPNQNGGFRQFQQGGCPQQAPMGNMQQAGQQGGNPMQGQQNGQAPAQQQQQQMMMQSDNNSGPVSPYGGPHF